ncbi:retrotransposon protein, putative, ty1-copia subclass [Tanacetum coccineum]|uniref:Retrotransposon protein, putative, ty1-copia subclass n=1 Tax=Tanacetum coccineum TaxID=301880 RepID=A0ABQ5CFG6_9ASTR
MLSSLRIASWYKKRVGVIDFLNQVGVTKDLNKFKKKIHNLLKILAKYIMRLRLLRSSLEMLKVPTCRFARIPQAPDRYGFYVDVEEYELGNLNKPPNYKAALSDPESDKWLEAQASRIWNKKFDVEIKKIGFTQNPDEPCVYLKASGSNVEFLILYVDDILLMRNNVTMLQEVKAMLCKCFSIKDLGEAAYILGIKIIRDRSKWLIALSQSDYLEKTLKKFRMENSKKGYTPIIEKPDYRKSQGAQTPSEVQHMRIVPYASAIGSIIYADRCTRPDVAFAQNLNTKDVVLMYGAKLKAGLRVSCYADASFQTDKDEAEYIAAVEASMEAV